MGCLTLRVVPRIMPLLHALSRTVAVLFAPTFGPPSPLRRYRRPLHAAATAHERYRCAGTPLPWHAALLRLGGMADGQRCSHVTNSLPSRCYDGTRAVHQWTVSQVRMCPLRSGSLPHHHRHHRHLRHHQRHPSLTRMACAPRVLFRSRRSRTAIARSWSARIATPPRSSVCELAVAPQTAFTNATAFAMPSAMEQLPLPLPSYPILCRPFRRLGPSPSLPHTRYRQYAF